MKSLLTTAILLFSCFLAALAQDDELKNSLDAFFQKAERYGYSGSVLIAKGDYVFLSKGYGKQDREKNIDESASTVFSVGSITKQFTGAAILKLEMLGKLSVTDPITKYFPDVPEDKASMTIHHLLTHSAGFPGGIGDDYELIKANDFLKRAWDTPLLFKPGTGHEYSNVGYSILGILIEKLSGVSYDTFLHDQLFKPAGMENTGYLIPQFKPEQLAVGYRNGQRWGTARDHAWLPDGPGWHLRANGGILSTVGDMHKWVMALLGDKVLSAAAKEKLFAPHQRECEDCPTFYGYGWVVDKTPSDETLIWHNGGNGVYNAYTGFIPSTGLTIVISSNSNDKIADDYAMKVLNILGGAGKGLDERFTNSNSGTYVLPSGSKVQVGFDELDRVWMEWTEADALQLLSGDGTEKPENVSPYEDRVRDMIKAARNGDFEPVAKALGVPVEEAKNMESEFWKNLEEKSGAFQSIDIIGSVLRPRRNACLVFAKARMQKGSRFITYVWVENHLRDVRSAEKMDKEFEHRNGEEFYAPNNDLKVYFKNNTILIEGKEGKHATLTKE